MKFHFVLLAFVWGFMAVAECDAQPTNLNGLPRFKLSLAPLIAQVGIATEETICTSENLKGTGDLEQRHIVRDIASFADFKFINRTLEWNTNNEYAKNVLKIDHCVFTQNGITNELLKPGMHIDGLFIAGEWLFVSHDGFIPLRVEKTLPLYFSIHPSPSLEDYDQLRLDQPRYVGEKWDVKLSPDFGRMDRFGDDFTKKFVNEIFQNYKTNKITGVATFVGTTNLFGINCFHLQLDIGPLDGTFKAAQVIINSKIDLIASLDASKAIWQKTASVNGVICFKEMTSEYTDVLLHRVDVTANVNILCRQLDGQR